jgi:hypothetical protein
LHIFTMDIIPLWVLDIPMRRSRLSGVA